MPLENRKCAKCHITTKNETEDDTNLRFHRLPLPGKYGHVRARVWAEFCFPAGNWSTEMSLKSLHQQHLLLCSKHFDDNAYTSCARKRLNNFAIPTGTEGIMLRLRQEQCASSSETFTNIPGPIEEIPAQQFLAADTTEQELRKVCQNSTAKYESRPVVSKELVMVTEKIEHPVQESTPKDDTLPVVLKVCKQFTDEASKKARKRKINILQNT